MIHYKKREELDIDKYNFCVENSIQSRVYAFSWYLDIVSDNWDALVLNDYEAVMPIPWNSKFGLKYVVQPCFCQQLNVYSKRNIDKTILDKFFKSIPIRYLFNNLNLGFQIIHKDIITKQNFILELNKTYDIVFKNYRKDRKKSLRKALQANLRFEDFENKKELIKLYKQVFEYLNTPEKYFITINKVIDFCLANNKGFIRNIYFNDELVCSGFFLKFNNRIYYLFAASSQKGKKYGATTFLLDSVIKQYANTNMVLDFEGSSIPSIESFYKSFGSDLEYYYNYKSNVFKNIFVSNKIKRS